jgi:hypothetical protein
MTRDGGENALGEHEQALGDAFFQGDAEALRARLALQSEEAAARGALAEATGIHDAEVLAELAGLGIRVDTLAALTLIPLIDVAWADGDMDAREREAILAAAAATGTEPGSTSYRLLEIWTEEQPPPDLTRAWQLFIQALCNTLDDDRSRRLALNLIGRARDVAAAAGSRLDRAPHVSAEEEACLTALAKAFPQAG